MTSSLGPITDEHQAPLCPACCGTVVRIETSIEVRYHVHFAVPAEGLEVIGEQLGDCEWDGATPAACDACGWRGSVADLLAGH